MKNNIENIAMNIIKHLQINDISAFNKPTGHAVKHIKQAKYNPDKRNDSNE